MTADLKVEDRRTPVLDHIDVFLLAGQFPAQSAAQALRNTITYAQAAEQAGFDTAWIAEHHFLSYGVCPSATILAGNILGATTVVPRPTQPLSVHVAATRAGHDQPRFDHGIARLAYAGQTAAAARDAVARSLPSWLGRTREYVRILPLWTDFPVASTSFCRVDDPHAIWERFSIS